MNDSGKPIGHRRKFDQPLSPNAGRFTAATQPPAHRARFRTSRLGDQTVRQTSALMDVLCLFE